MHIKKQSIIKILKIYSKIYSSMAKSSKVLLSNIVVLRFFQMFKSRRFFFLKNYNSRTINRKNLKKSVYLFLVGLTWNALYVLYANFTVNRQQLPPNNNLPFFAIVHFSPRLKFYLFNHN